MVGVSTLTFFMIANSCSRNMSNNGDVETSRALHSRCALRLHASFTARLARSLSRPRLLPAALAEMSEETASVVVVARPRVQVRVGSHRSRDVHGIRATRSRRPPVAAPLAPWGWTTAAIADSIPGPDGGVTPGPAARPAPVVHVSPGERGVGPSPSPGGATRARRRRRRPRGR